MALGERSGFKVGRYSVELDLTEVLCGILEFKGKHKEKYLLHWLLLKLSGHEVQMLNTLSQSFPELGKRMIPFFQKRVEDYRKASRLSKVISFRSAKSIEDEAVKRAWQDAETMLRGVSMLENESVRDLIDDHRRMLKRLCSTLIRLVMEKGGGQVDLDLNALGKFLGGGTP